MARDLAEFEVLRSSLPPEERNGLPQWLLISASIGGET